jgi:hypothetical protein
MTEPLRSQFTIGRLMAITAIFGLLLAGSLGEGYGGGYSWLLSPQFFVDGLIALSLIVVYARNVPLSRHLRWVVAALLVQSVMHVLLILLLVNGPFFLGTPRQILISSLQLFTRSLSILYIWKLYQAFRDIQDRLTRAEVPSKEGVGDANLCDSGDADGPFSPPRDTPP